MPTVGVTGHVEVPVEMRSWVVRELTGRLSQAVAGGWQGVTCLAPGADQIFATAIAGLGGRYDVILPASDYGSRLRNAGHAQPFRRLLNGAARVDLMPFRTSSREAYLAASVEMLGRCQELLAVYDGRPSGAVGDTADVLRVAHALGVPVRYIWPGGARAQRMQGAGVVLSTSQFSAAD